MKKIVEEMLDALASPGKVRWIIIMLIFPEIRRVAGLLVEYCARAVAEEKEAALRLRDLSAGLRGPVRHVDLTDDEVAEYEKG